jgi:hypothetical protein
VSRSLEQSKKDSMCEVRQSEVMVEAKSRCVHGHNSLGTSTVDKIYNTHLRTSSPSRRINPIATYQQADRISDIMINALS